MSVVVCGVSLILVHGGRKSVGMKSSAVGRRRLLSTFVEKDLLFSCTRAGGYQALRPTAEEFIPTLDVPTLLPGESARSFSTMLGSL